jgi:hypothetical protein
MRCMDGQVAGNWMSSNPSVSVAPTIKLDPSNFILVIKQQLDDICSCFTRVDCNCWKATNLYETVYGLIDWIVIIRADRPNENIFRR